MVAEGRRNKRTIKADDFFKGLLTTALAPDEILTQCACGDETPAPRA
jgi:CO/xanthine dehydrogenase FAD-binding subunit